MHGHVYVSNTNSCLPRIYAYVAGAPTSANTDFDEHMQLHGGNSYSIVSRPRNLSTR
jgi:hypothetical protein